MNENNSLSHVWIILAIIVLIVIIMVIVWFDVGYTLGLNNCDLEILNLRYWVKPRVNSKHRVVISLTTIPDRIKLLRPTIVSLLSQSHRVDAIKLNLPYYSSKGKPYIIPKWLKQLNSIQLVRVNCDDGPATKLLPTLRNVENENTRIIVVDDDVIYGHYLIKNLIDTFERLNKHGKVAVTTVV